MTNPLQDFQDNFAKELFGMAKAEALAYGICVQCRQEALPRCHSLAGRQEYKISGICEICWDKMFLTTEEG